MGPKKAERAKTPSAEHRASEGKVQLPSNNISYAGARKNAPRAPRAHPDISVVFGTYNRLISLKRCVESLRKACGARSYEIVVAAGPCTDGSIEWLKVQPNVVVVEQPYLLGGVAAFNAAFAVSSGDYVVNFNDDAYVGGANVFAKAISILDKNPQAGQLAFSHGRGKNIHQCVDGKLYANFGMIRRTLVDRIVDVCGNFWNPVYFTYAADAEVGCWVSRLGSEVMAAPEIHIEHDETIDALRTKSNYRDNQGQKDNGVFCERWGHNEGRLAPKGPLPQLTPGEMVRLHRFEEASVAVRQWLRPTQAPVAAPQASNLDVSRFRLDGLVEEEPVFSQELPKERVLHIHLGVPEEPQTGLVSALKTLGDQQNYMQINWIGLSKHDLEKRLITATNTFKPTFLFAQLQNSKVIDSNIVDKVRELAAPDFVAATWSGDVGGENSTGAKDSAWAMKLARSFDLMLYSSTEHVDVYRSRGMSNAAYLQIGYDEDRYFEKPQTAKSFDVAFLATHYQSPLLYAMPHHQIEMRNELFKRIDKEFGARAALHGGGWPGRTGIAASASGAVYQKSHCAISVSITSSYGRYSSDRLLRILACGTPALVKRFKGFESWGLVDGENCFLWDTIEECLSRIVFVKAHPDYAAKIGRAGAQLAREKHTWLRRMHELAPWLTAVRNERKE